jgi:2-oxoisovalerate dehydrogenase E1 component alpha subunit
MLIRMMRTGHGYFWIGGPGEEGFNVPLGLLLKKGHGPDYDYLHLHYRSSAIVLTMGAAPIDILRQMRSTVTDPYSKGRNFVNHFAIKRWNIVPVTPAIETQYVVAPGTAHVQRRHGGSGLSIVNGGDAGSAEGDFWSCMNWSTRPGHELPVLILLAQNKWGISTPATQTQNTLNLNERANGFGIRNQCVDGNDPIASYHAIREAMQYIREERKPYVLQANVSRLYGHSSSSGASRYDEPDCLQLYEQRLVRDGLMTEAEQKAVWDRWQAHLGDALKQVVTEPMPGKDDVLTHVFYDGPAGN